MIHDVIKAAAGQSNGITIYWHWRDPSPAYRYDDGSYSGPLEFVRWSNDDGEGYSLTHYFGADGRYLGPDQDGVFPIFAIA